MKTKSILTILGTGLIVSCAAYILAIAQVEPRNKSANSHWNPALRQRRERQFQLDQDAAMALNGEKDLPKAERLFRQALRLNDADDDAWLGLARIADKQGKTREALALYQSLLGPHRNWVSAESNDVAVLTRYAELSEHFGKTEQAVQAYQKVLQVSARDGHVVGRDPNMPVGTNTTDPNEIRARAHILLGLAHQAHREGIFIPEREMPDLALQAFQEAVRIKPDLPIAHYYLGDQLRTLHHTKEANAEFARAESLGDDAFRAAMHKRENDAKQRMTDLEHRNGVSDSSITGQADR